MVTESDEQLTEQQIEQRDALAALEVTEPVRAQLKTLLAQDFAELNGVLAQSNADLRADPSQEIKIMARVLRRLVRVANDDFTGTD